MEIMEVCTTLYIACDRKFKQQTKEKGYSAILSM